MFEEKIGDIGEIRVHHVEPNSQSIRFVLSVPSFTLFTLLPLFSVDMSLMGLELAPDKKVFLPPYDLKDFAVQITSDQAKNVNQFVRVKVNEYLSTLNELRQLVDDPLKIMPLLPLGVGVDVDFGCSSAALLTFIGVLNDQQTPLSVALADAFTTLLSRICKSYGWATSLILNES